MIFFLQLIGFWEPHYKRPEHQQLLEIGSRKETKGSDSNASAFKRHFQQRISCTVYLYPAFTQAHLVFIHLLLPHQSLPPHVDLNLIKLF